jgi:NAD(P)-dependent dehydrogenase (short-subunit alcohol dehydrogenase family)
MGFAAAARLAEAGATVTITGRSRDKLDAAVAKLPPGKATAHAADATSEADMRRVFDALPAFDHLIVAIGNNAPYGGAKPFRELDEATLRRDFEEKFFAYVRAVRLAADKVRRSVTLVTGASAHTAFPGPGNPQRF